MVTLPLSWPTAAPKGGVAVSVLSQGFGEYGDGDAARFHTGFDIQADLGTVVLAAADGWVAMVEKNDPTHACGTSCDHGMGNTIVLGHVLVDGRTLYSQYSHLLDWPTTNTVYAAVLKTCTASKPTVRWKCPSNAVLVTRGQTIGAVGNTGGGTTPYDPHLHFEVKATASLSPVDDDMVVAPEWWGYRDINPEGSAYSDPALLFHPDAVPFTSPRAIRLAAGVSTTGILMGPGGETMGGAFVRYRAIENFTSALELQAVASSRVSSSTPCTQWLRVQRADGSRIRDRLDPIPTEGVRYGELPSGWVCADNVTEAIPPAIFGISLTSGGAPSDLYEVEAGANGLDHRIARVQTAAGELPALTDITLLPDGSLLGASLTTLYQIDRKTGVAVALGVTGATDINGLTVSAAGEVFASTTDGLLLRRVGQTWQSVGSYGSGFASSGDLAFAPNGDLYGTVSSFFGNDALVKIQITNGHATMISPVGGIGFTNVWGLTFVSGTLYGLVSGRGSQGELIRIDGTTGVGTALRDLTFGPSGSSDRVPPNDD
jgi:murein DD-endopeptidase MepM/ murein hydrolase activator NlpD